MTEWIKNLRSREARDLLHQRRTHRNLSRSLVRKGQVMTLMKCSATWESIFLKNLKKSHDVLRQQSRIRMNTHLNLVVSLDDQGPRRWRLTMTLPQHRNNCPTETERRFRQHSDCRKVLHRQTVSRILRSLLSGLTTTQAGWVHQVQINITRRVHLWEDSRSLLLESLRLGSPDWEEVDECLYPDHRLQMSCSVHQQVNQSKKTDTCCHRLRPLEVKRKVLMMTSLEMMSWV